METNTAIRILEVKAEPTLVLHHRHRINHLRKAPRPAHTLLKAEHINLLASNMVDSTQANIQANMVVNTLDSMEVSMAVSTEANTADNMEGWHKINTDKLLSIPALVLDPNMDSNNQITANSSFLVSRVGLAYMAAHNQVRKTSTAPTTSIHRHHRKSSTEINHHLAARRDNTTSTINMELRKTNLAISKQISTVSNRFLRLRRHRINTSMASNKVIRRLHRSILIQTNSINHSIRHTLRINNSQVVMVAIPAKATLSPAGND